MPPKLFLQSHSDDSGRNQRSVPQISSTTYLSPKALITVKTESTMRIFATTYRFHGNKIIQKYFGRKVAHVTHNSGIPSAKSLCRYIKKVDLSEDDRHEFTLAHYNFKSLGDRVLWDDSVKIKRKDYQRLVSNCDKLLLKPKGSSKALKPIRCLMKNLKYFSLTFWSYDIEDPFLNMLPKSLQPKCFITLYAGKVSYEDLSNLLDYLDKSQVQGWYVDADLIVKRLTEVDMKSMAHVLEKIDCLGLTVLVAKVDECPDIPGAFNETEELTAKRKRVLNLTFTYDNKYCDEEKVIDELEIGILDLEMILKHCKSLEGLHIKSIWNILQWPSTVQTINEEKKDGKTKQSDRLEAASILNLKDVVLITNDIVETYDAYSLIGFLKLIQRYSPLRSLNLFYCNTEKEYKVEKYRKIYDRLKHSVFIPRLDYVESLEELTLHCNHESSSRIRENLNSLKNLKKFTLYLCESENSYCWDKTFPFESMTHLTEFHLISRYGSNMLPWGEILTQNISNLSNLKVLVLQIRDRTIFMEIYVFYDLIKGLTRFENLQKLRIDTQVKREVSKAMQFLFGEEEIKKKELKVFEDIKAMIRRLIDANPMLEELDISRIEGYDISRIFYNRMMIKD